MHSREDEHYQKFNNSVSKLIFICFRVMQVSLIVWSCLIFKRLVQFNASVCTCIGLTLSLPNVAKRKFWPNFQISFSKILTNKYHQVKVPAESFHLNGHIIGFGPQTQKLEPPYKIPSSTLAANPKGQHVVPFSERLIVLIKFCLLDELTCILFAF